MNVLSLFDGISCARVAFERAGIKINKYYASEIDKYAIKISQKNFPDIIHLGDVRYITKEKIKDNIDLIIGGSPCQDLSIIKKDRQGLKGSKSCLFWEYIRCLREFKPSYFIFENVASMTKSDSIIISQEIGKATEQTNCLIPNYIEPVMIDAALVSAQRRKRFFWTNIQVNGLPKDRNIKLIDILEKNVDKKYYIKNKSLNLVIENLNKYGEKYIKINGDKSGTLLSRYGNLNGQLIFELGNGGQGNRVYDANYKSVTLSSNGGGRGAKTGLYYLDGGIRKLTPIECERLQGLPDNYTEGISDTQRWKCIGNGFNVDVVCHIIKHIV